jgi:hypothetical protein
LLTRGIVTRRAETHIGADFGTVDRDMIEPDEARFAAERQNLHEQA